MEGLCSRCRRHLRHRIRSGLDSTPSICKITDAKLVRNISGSVNSGRDKKSSSEYKRIQIPASTRPQRPTTFRNITLASQLNYGNLGEARTLRLKPVPPGPHKHTARIQDLNNLIFGLLDFGPGLFSSLTSRTSLTGRLK